MHLVRSSLVNTIVLSADSLTIGTRDSFTAISAEFVGQLIIVWFILWSRLGGSLISCILLYCQTSMLMIFCLHLISKWLWKSESTSPIIWKYRYFTEILFSAFVGYCLRLFLVLFVELMAERISFIVRLVTFASASIFKIPTRSDYSVFLLLKKILRIIWLIFYEEM